MERRLSWTACTNVRDLGGLRTRGGETRFGSVVRADNLLRLDEAGRAALLRYGVGTVIDLRAEWEIARFPYPFERDALPGVEVRSVPLISNANWEAAAKTEPGEHPYVLIAKLSAPNIVSAISSVAHSERGVVIHCHEGRERTGIVAAVLLELAGVDDTTIAEDWVASQPEALKATDILPVLAHMRSAHGSVSAFLIANGLSNDDLAAAIARLRDH